MAETSTPDPVDRRDPVEIVAREISCGAEGCQGCARTGLEALTDAGWRIVRTDPEDPEHALAGVLITEEWSGE